MHLLNPLPWVGTKSTVKKRIFSPKKASDSTIDMNLINILASNLRPQQGTKHPPILIWIVIIVLILNIEFLNSS